MASSPLTAVGFPPAEESRRGWLSLVLLFVLPAAIFGALVAYGQLERSTAATPQQGTPGSLVWGDGKVIFSNKAQLAAWLRLHGSSYSAFVKRHPDALRLVTARPRRHTAAATGTKKHVAAPAHPAAKPARPATTATQTVAAATAATNAAASPAAQTTTANGTKTLVFGLAAALGILVGALALLPPAVLRRFGVRSAAERELRFSAAAVSVAILAGVLFGMLVG